MTKMLLLCLFVCASVVANAASSGGSGGKSSGMSFGSFGKGSIGWFGVGSGTNTVSDPKDELNYTNQFSVMSGGDIALFGPFFFSISAFGKWSVGKMSYDYTDNTGAHYTAKNVSVSATTAGGDAGLHLNLINGSHMHLFVEGGGFYQSVDYSYGFTDATSVSSGGSNQEGSQKSVAMLGTYAKAGIDLVVVKGFGLRVLGRASKGSSAAIDALAKQKLKFVEGEGYAGLFKQF